MGVLGHKKVAPPSLVPGRWTEEQKQRARRPPPSSSSLALLPSSSRVSFERWILEDFVRRFRRKGGPSLLVPLGLSISLFSVCLSSSV